MKIKEQESRLTLQEHDDDDDDDNCIIEVYKCDLQLGHELYVIHARQHKTFAVCVEQSCRSSSELPTLVPRPNYYNTRNQGLQEHKKLLDQNEPFCSSSLETDAGTKLNVLLCVSHTSSLQLAADLTQFVC